MSDGRNDIWGKRAPRRTPSGSTTTSAAESKPFDGAAGGKQQVLHLGRSSA